LSTFITSSIEFSRWEKEKDIVKDGRGALTKEGNTLA
jgi:hypothetical protein